MLVWMVESVRLELQHAIRKGCDAVSKSQDILKNYGFSQACLGCHAAQFGLRQGISREHAKECRARVEIAIRIAGEDYQIA